MKTFSEMQILKNVSPVHLFMGSYQMSSNKTSCKPRNSKTRGTENQRIHPIHQRSKGNLQVTRRGKYADSTMFRGVVRSDWNSYFSVSAI